MVGPFTMGRTVARPRNGEGLIPPPAGVGLPGPYVYDAQSARRIPAVGRAIQLYSGMCKQMAMHLYRNGVRLPAPRLLGAPDPDNSGPWFVHVSVEDYLLQGNALCVVTVRGADGWPLAVKWIPASWASITWFPGDPTSIAYWYLGQPLPVDDVVHIKRGADRRFPVRGVGVVEEYLDTLDRVAMEEEFERSALAGGAVPSVAVITPTPTLSPEEAAEAKERWMEKFGGPVREPVILPNGTQVVPLAWSPTDTQLTEARKASLTDVANMFNLDGYWLGAPVAGMTYRTAGPQYQQILKTSLEPVLADFEATWSEAWLPRGQKIRFDRHQLLKEDLVDTANSLATLVGAGIMSTDDAASYLGISIAGGVPLELQGGQA